MNFERQFDEQVIAQLRRRVRRRPDAAALRALQQRPQVRDAGRAGAGLRRRRRRDRPLRAGRARRRTGATCCAAASTPAKDQSYFLFSLTQAQLACAVFPVGELPKDEVRDYARQRAAAGGRQAGQPGDLLHPGQRLPRLRDQERAARRRAEAHFVDESGRVLGTPRRHPPVHGRPAQGARPRRASSRPRAPMYVLALRPADQQVVVGPKASLEQTRLTASGVNWIVEEPAGGAARHRADPASPSGGAGRRAIAGRRARRSDLRRAAAGDLARPGGGVLRRRRGRRRRLDRLTETFVVRRSWFVVQRSTFVVGVRVRVRRRRGRGREPTERRELRTAPDAERHRTTLQTLARCSGILSR